MASFSANNGQEDQVLVEAKSFVRTLILNRPKQLNALSYHMISRLLELFFVYEKDSNVKLVILKGKGRAFCAGGDVAAVVRDINNGNWKSGDIYFRKEFTLNYLMATYSKPQVSILNGIVMGGGAGCSVHGSFRVATEKSVFAMPETALGLFPDIGASYFLSRLPGHFGNGQQLKRALYFYIQFYMSILIEDKKFLASGSMQIYLVGRGLVVNCVRNILLAVLVLTMVDSETYVTSKMFELLSQYIISWWIFILYSANIANLLLC